MNKFVEFGLSMNEILISLLVVIIFFLAGWIIATRRRSLSLEEVIKHPLTQSEIEKAHLKGIEKGRNEQQRRLTCNVIPFNKKEDKFLGLKTITTAGYTMQLYYDDLPIGEPMTRFLAVQEKVDKEKVAEIAKEVSKVTSLLAKAGILPCRLG